MFLFKKIAAPFLFPVPLCLEILLVGLFLLWFSRRKTTGKIVTSLGVLLLGILSYGGVSDFLLRPLEQRYAPLRGAEGIAHVGWVVVLGGGVTSDPTLPVTGQISESSLVRLVEGIRIHRMLPASKLILSGGVVFDPVPEAKVMADVAVALGVQRADLLLESGSRDTEEEARLVKPIVGDDPFVLVTSASHMPRSVALFKNLGMKPIPAPTGHWVRRGQATSPDTFFPSAEGLCKAQTAVYEYLGLAWARLRGQL